MRIADYTMKYGRWLPFLAGCIVLGCTSGPQQQKGAWPWEYGKDYGNHQTGDYFAMSGSVAHFGEVPKAIKPITPESLDPPIHSETSATKTQPPLPTNSELASGKIANKVKREYDFTLGNIKLAPPSYMQVNSVSTDYNITAFNHGNAPVSVAIGIDPNTSQNISTDKTLPLDAVVPPNTDQALVHFAPKMKNEAHNFSYTYSWSIGDYTANHQCTEHYRFPFGDNVRAFANVSDKANSTPYTRYAVIFSMPAGTPVLAARKGTVIQIKTDDKIDILHDDSTIATYSHLGKIDQGIIAGKVVTTEDIIGIVGATGNQKEAYMQLTVWRPEPVPPIASLKTNSPSSGFDLVSFPLEFCSTDSKECRVLTQDQAVSRNKIAEIKKQVKRKLKLAKRKDGNP